MDWKEENPLVYHHREFEELWPASFFLPLPGLFDNGSLTEGSMPPESSRILPWDAEHCPGSGNVVHTSNYSIDCTDCNHCFPVGLSQAYFSSLTSEQRACTGLRGQLCAGWTEQALFTLNSGCIPFIYTPLEYKINIYKNIFLYIKCKIPVACVSVQCLAGVLCIMDA